MLGLGNSLKRTGVAGATNLGIVTDNLVMKHMYPLAAVQPLSDGALHLDGTSDSYAYNNTTETITGDITVILWLWSSNADSGTRTIFNLGLQANNDGFLWSYFDDDDLKIQYDGAASTGNFSTIKFQDEYEVATEQYKWHHWAITYDVSEADPVKAYKNGVEMTQDAATNKEAPQSAISSEAWSIGSYNKGSHLMTGYMCNFGVWNSVLTQPQIKNVMWQDYNGAKSAVGNPLHWWAFDEGTGGTATDQGSAGLDLTLSGT